MGNFRKINKRAAKATGTVDKAQNELMKRMNKKLDELEGSVESKYGIQSGQDAMDSYSGTSSLTQSNQIIPIEIGINQGVQDNERIGDQVTFKHLDFEYRLSLPFLRVTEYGQAVNTCRVFLFWDSQPSAISSAGGTVVNPTYWPQVLQEATIGATANATKTQVILSQKDWDQSRRFQIIYDKTHTLSSNASGDSIGLGARSCTGVVRFSKNYAKQRIRFVAGGTVVQNRQLYLGYLSDAGNPQGSPALSCRRPQIDYNLRVIYNDL